jgi:hypothetical protein
MKLLSLKELDMFDYVKTKEKVEAYIGDLNMIKYKYRNVLPPPIASRLFDIKVQSSGVQIDLGLNLMLRKGMNTRENINKSSTRYMK